MSFFNRGGSTPPPPEPDPDERFTVVLQPPDSTGRRRFTLPDEEPTMSQTPDEQFDGGKVLTPEQYEARKAWDTTPARVTDEPAGTPSDPTPIDYAAANRMLGDDTDPATSDTQLTITPEDICPNCGQRMPTDAALLQAGVDLLTSSDVTDQLVVRFYEIVFDLAPAAKDLFTEPATDTTPAKSWQELVDITAPKDSWGRGQRDKIVSAIALLAQHYGDTDDNSDDPEFLDRALVAMGRGHAKYNLTVDHYGVVGTALLRALKEFAGDAWTPAMEAAWIRAYKYMAGTMLRGEATPNRGQTGRRRRA